MNRRTLLVLSAVVAIAAVGLRFQPSPLTLVTSCVRSSAWPPALLWLTTSADLRIFVAYVWISAALVRLRPRLGIPLDWIFSAFAAFILSCGLTHLLKAVTAFWPTYWLAYDVEELTANVSLGTAVALTWVVAPKLIAEAARYRGALAAEQARTREAEERGEGEARERHAAEGREEEELRAEQARTRAALEREQRLREALATAGAAVMVLGDGVIAMAVVGPVDAERGYALMSTACYAVSRERARALVVDVSAVPEMDTGAAGALGDVAGAVGRLGARCVVAGIKPEIAMTMQRAKIEFDAAKTATTRDVADALALALLRRG